MIIKVSVFLKSTVVDRSTVTNISTSSGVVELWLVY